MQKIINVLSIASFVISTSIAGAGVYVYANKDALIESAKEKIMKQVGEAATGAVLSLPLSLTYSTPQAPPVSLNLGTPIIELPGCVEFNRANKESQSLVDDDPKGNVVLCDGSMPSFNPIDFEPEQIILTKPAGVPVIPNTENGTDTDTDAAVPPTGDIPTNTSNIICPPREAPVVGTKVEGGKKKISGYEIQNNRCVTLYEEVPIINQVVAGLPSTGAVTTTASIAVVATSSALLAKPLADLILKVIKPTIKTLMKKLQKLRGKPPKAESRMERILAQRDRNRAIRTLRTALKK
jgi:hypothetical protein